MKLNRVIVSEFLNSSSRLLAVTKYWNQEETKELLSQFWEDGGSILIGLWENRVSTLKEKQLEREAVHFIWNIQTKEIKFITQYCSTIHSLDTMKHVRKIDDICEKQWKWVKVFIQVQLDTTKPWGVQLDEIPSFIEAIDGTDNISLIWFSAIWKSECGDDERREEFTLLKQLKNKYLPNGIISAGTSRDYKIALEEGIDIVRVWQALVW